MARGLGILGVSELIALTCLLLQLPALSTAMRSLITGQPTALGEALSSDMMETLLVVVRIIGGLAVLGATCGLALCILARSEAVSRALAVLALVLRAAALLMVYDVAISGDPGGLLPAFACYLISALAISAMLWRVGSVLGDPALGKGSRTHMVSIVALIAIVGGLARRVRAFIPEETDPAVSLVLVLVIAFLLLAWLFAYAYLAGQGMRSIHRAGTISRARLAPTGAVG
jgi:hypothetical protein